MATRTPTSTPSTTSPEPAYTAMPPARLVEPLHSDVKRVHHHGPGRYHGVVRVARHCSSNMVTHQRLHSKPRRHAAPMSRRRAPPSPSDLTVLQQHVTVEPPSSDDGEPPKAELSPFLAPQWSLCLRLAFVPCSFTSQGSSRPCSTLHRLHRPSNHPLLRPDQPQLTLATCSQSRP